MSIPLQITFHGMQHSDSIEAVVRKRAARLERFCDRITACHVTIDIPHRHHHKGNHLAVRIEVSTPTGDVAVTRDPSLDDSHKDVAAVIRDAFDSAVRHLEDNAERHRSPTMSHQDPPHGRVTRLFPQGGYGFLETTDGREIYFHENSVADAGFGRLSIESRVRFTLAPEDSDQGPRAASVQRLGL
jgi:cold shock CspA family protein